MHVVSLMQSYMYNWITAAAGGLIGSASSSSWTVSVFIRYIPWEGPIYSFKGLSLGRSLVHLGACTHEPTVHMCLQFLILIIIKKDISKDSSFALTI